MSIANVDRFNGIAPIGAVPVKKAMAFTIDDDLDDEK